MALFGTTKKDAAPKAKKSATKALAPKDAKSAAPTRDFSWVIIRPRITEKATMLSEKKVYAFEVSPRATSNDVKYAILAQYQVMPRKVNMVQTPGEMKPSRRGGMTRISGVRKAYVYLKKDDSISLA
jgi:large subunit ribosomal protein L23